MKKKFFAMLLTAALVAAQGITAFANVSSEAGSTIGSSSDPFIEVLTPEAKINQITAEDIDTLVGNVQAEVNVEALKTQLTAALAGNAEEIIKSMDGSDALKGFQMLKPNSGSGLFYVTKGSPNTVEMRAPKLPQNVTVYALHLNDATGKWERLDVKIEGGIMKLTSLNGWSPVVLVYKENADASNSGGGSSGGGNSSSGSSSSAGLVTSPRTGMSSDWNLWMCAAVALLAVSSVIFRRKEA